MGTTQKLAHENKGGSAMNHWPPGRWIRTPAPSQDSGTGRRSTETRNGNESPNKGKRETRYIAIDVDYSIYALSAHEGGHLGPVGHLAGPGFVLASTLKAEGSTWSFHMPAPKKTDCPGGESAPQTQHHHSPSSPTCSMPLSWASPHPPPSPLFLRK